MAGLNMSPELKIKALTPAAEGGNISAMKDLADTYEQIGTKEALDKAEEWRGTAVVSSHTDGK